MDSEAALGIAAAVLLLLVLMALGAYALRVLGQAEKDARAPKAASQAHATNEAVRSLPPPHPQNTPHPHDYPHPSSTSRVRPSQASTPSFDVGN